MGSWRRSCVLFVGALALVATTSGIESAQEIQRKEVLVLTVATEDNDGFQRFVNSAKKHGLKYKAIGMGMEWRGGDVARYPGGGFKVNLLKAAMEEFKNRTDLVIMFTDSYDVVFTDGAASILKVFSRCNCRVLFSAEGYCWPDASLAEKYPPVRTSEKRFLNSGGFIGFAEDIYELVTLKTIADTDDDQLYFTNIFLDEFAKAKEGEAGAESSKYGTSGQATTASTALKIKLDVRSELFQNLNGALGDVSVKFKGSASYLYNHVTGNTPIVLHGNGPIKAEFNRITNYLGGNWSPTHGCAACRENRRPLTKLSRDEYPVVFVAVIGERATPFLPYFYERLLALDYPKNKMDIFVFNDHVYNVNATNDFVAAATGSYRSLKFVDREVDIREGRYMAVQECLKLNCEYFFALDTEAQLTNPSALQLLVEQNRPILSPLLKRPGRNWSNFWGALNDQGYYARSDDYMEILEDKKVGLWNVPYISNAILIHGEVLKKFKSNPYAHAGNPAYDSEIAFTANMRDWGLFMLVDNQQSYGHLINPDEFNVNRARPEMYELFTNRIEWEMKYLHPDYSAVLQPDYKFEQPCTDVFWYPSMSDAFCDDLIATMEAFGEWSNGKNEDTRLQGGYENVPTRDIHMNQVGFEEHWLQMLRDYVKPVQEKAFAGYHSDLRAIMNFVVRYKPDEQPSLRPHHDAATFTLNLALNTRGVDYQGGGVRFLRYNCTLLDLRKGWQLMHPGRLTHYHEGLTTTGGTRYIMVTFVDP